MLGSRNSELSDVHGARCSGRSHIRTEGFLEVDSVPVDSGPLENIGVGKGPFLLGHCHLFRGRYNRQTEQSEASGVEWLELDT